MQITQDLLVTTQIDPDVYATELHGTATRAGVVTSIGTHDIGGLQNVDETGKPMDTY